MGRRDIVVGRRVSIEPVDAGGTPVAGVPIWTPAYPQAATPTALPIPPSAFRHRLSPHLEAKSQHMCHLSAIRCLELSPPFNVIVWADPPVATAAWLAADTD
jgi:hypothetical protein